MKTAKARLTAFELECPECGGCLASAEGEGSLTWSVDEPAPETAVCVDCGKTSKVPKLVKGARIQK